MPYDIFPDIETELDEEIQNIPNTSCGNSKRPILYTTDKSPEEILTINAKNFKADVSINADSSVFYESRSVAKNLTGISANSTLAEKSTVADSLGGIASYTNVGFFRSFGFVHSLSNGSFANSLATNGNGNLIIVGNKTFSSDGYYVGVGTTTGRSNFYGIAYMFERTNSNNFVNRGYVVGRYSKVGSGATNAGDDFGHSVAMSADGKTVVVGGSGITGESTDTGGSAANCGVVWIYDFSASGSCGSGYFEKVAKFEGEEAGDLFGQSVAISADAKIVVVGATGARVNDVGYAYVYERNDNSYSQVGILTALTSGNFGSSVSTSADGNTIVVGDSSGNTAYVFDRDEDDIDEDNQYLCHRGISVFDIDDDNRCSIFELVATLSNTGGTKVCISDDGQTIITADATNSTVYSRLGDSFTYRGTLIGGAVAVTCSSDGKIITTASSSAYRVYNREGNTFYLNHTGSSTINSFDMSTNTKTLYRGIISEDIVYCDDQSLETFVYTDASGNVGIGTDAPTEKLHVIGNGKFSGIVSATSFSGSISGSSVTGDIAGTAGGLTGSPSIVVSAVRSANLSGAGNRTVYSDANGNLTNSSSDERLKENIVDLSYGLDTICSLNPIFYNWIDKEKLGSQRELGLIAQEVQKFIPEVIGVSYEETLTLDYAKLTPVLIKAIQELKEENEMLKSQIQFIAEHIGISSIWEESKMTIYRTYIGDITIN